MDNSPEANAVEVLSLTRRFGSLVAVDHLNFVCPSGSTFGLLGPNGAGKSTLIKMLTTLLPPSEGTAKIDGFDLVQHPEAVRRKIGYVSQMLSADGDLTGYENLLISAKLYGMPRSERPRRIAQAFEFMESRERRGQTRASIFRGHDPAAGNRTIHVAPAQRSLSRRAIGGSGPCCEAICLGTNRGIAPRVWHDDPFDHARYGRGVITCATRWRSCIAESSPRLILLLRSRRK